MGDIVIWVSNIGAGNNHEVLADCIATLDNAETGQTILFQCALSYSAPAAVNNATIKNAAIAEALSQASYVVGALDKKTLIGGAVGL